MPQYVLSEADKNALARLLSKMGSAPPRPAAFAPPIRSAKGPDAMWALPPCRLGVPPASTVFEDGAYRVIPGEAVCCLWHDVGRGMEPMVDPMGNPIRLTVYNYDLGNGIHGLLQIYRHRDGKWVAEQPETQVTTTQNPASTSTTLPPSPCTGDCVFTANSSLEWTGPTGGCAGTTTTTTTTTTSTTTTSSTTTTTASPAACVGKPCRLVCVDTGTTPAPIDGIPPPYVKYKYELLTGYACEGDCACYGLGDPCFLEDGEIVSQCLVGTTTTTPAPTVYSPCELAEILMGAPAPGESRFAALPGKPETWEVCQACDFGSFLRYGTLEQMEETIYNDIVLVAKQTCLKDPCRDITAGSLALRQNATYYAAYNHAEQAFGAVPPEMIDLKTGAELFAAGLPGNYDPAATYYKLYWKKCLNCPQGQRDEDPEYLPGDYIRTVTPQELIDYGDETSESYDPDYPIRHYAKTVEISIKCVPGPDCSFCSEFPVPPTTTSDPSVTTTTLTPTTTSTTTTLAPCSCPQPAFCPTVSGQCTKTVCQRGGSALPAPICGSTTTPAPNTCFDGLLWRTCPDCGYVGNSTTTTGTTTTGAPCSIPSVTFACQQSKSGGLPVNIYVPQGGCCPGYVFGYASPVLYNGFPCTTCGSTTTVDCVPISTSTTLAPIQPGCAGGEALWVAMPIAGGNQAVGPWDWELVSDTCACLDAIHLAPQRCCVYDRPADPPASGCDRTYTPCHNPTGYQPCCCTTLAPCNQSCTWNSPGGSVWDKIIDPCTPTCPCPAPNREPTSTCDTYTARCNEGTTTTTTSTTSTTTTTIAPIGACCQSGACYATNAVSCTSGGGLWLGASSTCDGCTGACCQEGTSSCFVTFESSCYATAGFIFGGIGSTCAGSPCLSSTLPPTTTTTSTTTTTTSTTTTTAAPTGACCVASIGYACLGGVTAAVCADNGGTYQGNGSACSACSGACCTAFGTCSVATYSFCNAYGGSWGGIGTGCSPNPCPTTTAIPTSTLPGP